jgi:hypothetical protein
MILALIWLGGLGPEYLIYDSSVHSFQNTMHLT